MNPSTVIIVYIVAVIVVGSIIVSIFKLLWNKFMGRYEAGIEEKQVAALIKRLAYSFPDFSAEFTNDAATKIFRAEERREEDVKEAMHNGSLPHTELMSHPYDIYLKPFLSTELCQHIESDEGRKAIFHVDVHNAIYEAGAKARMWINVEGKICFNYSDGDPLPNAKHF